MGRLYGSSENDTAISVCMVMVGAICYDTLGIR
jgi:hypothetical protein